MSVVGHLFFSRPRPIATAFRNSEVFSNGCREMKVQSRLTYLETIGLSIFAGRLKS